MSEASPRPVLQLIGVLWLLALVAIIGVYYVFNFTQYMDTIPKESERNFSLTSSAFENEGVIPAAYTCDGMQMSPPLTIHGAPEGTQSYAIVMEDRDVPKSLKPDGVFLHWLIFNILPTVETMGANEVLGTEGASGNGTPDYVGPCPPPQYDPAEHRYYFDAYALDTALHLSPGADISSFRATIEGHVLAQTTLMGRYTRQEK